MDIILIIELLEHKNIIYIYFILKFMIIQIFMCIFMVSFVDLLNLNKIYALRISFTFQNIKCKQTFRKQ